MFTKVQTALQTTSTKLQETAAEVVVVGTLTTMALVDKVQAKLAK